MNKPFKPTKAHQTKKIKEAIKLLNDIVRIKIAPSSIHGVGIFAMRDLKKGEVLCADAIPQAFDIPYKDFKKLNPEVRDIILGHWPHVVNGSHFLYPVAKMVAFMNHSSTPNYDAKNDVMLVDVKAGDEVTEDYSLIENSEIVFPWLKALTGK